MMHRWTATAAALILACSLLATPQQARAQQAGASTAPSLLTLRAEEADSNPETETLLLTARLVGTDAAPVDGQRITFLVEVDFPGAELLLIGSKTTDATGQARLKYLPTWTGEHRLIASAGPPGSGTAVTAMRSVQVDWLPGAYVELPRILRPLEIHLVWVVGAVVITVWLALAWIAVRTVYGITHAGGGGSPPPPLLERQAPR